MGLHWHTRWNVYPLFRELSLLLLLLPPLPLLYSILSALLYICTPFLRAVFDNKKYQAEKNFLSIDGKFPQFYYTSTLVHYSTLFRIGFGVYLSNLTVDEWVCLYLNIIFVFSVRAQVEIAWNHTVYTADKVIKRSYLRTSAQMNIEWKLDKLRKFETKRKTTVRHPNFISFFVMLFGRFFCRINVFFRLLAWWYKCVLYGRTCSINLFILFLLVRETQKVCFRLRKLIFHLFLISFFPFPFLLNFGSTEFNSIEYPIYFYKSEIRMEMTLPPNLSLCLDVSYV